MVGGMYLGSGGVPAPMMDRDGLTYSPVPISTRSVGIAHHSFACYAPLKYEPAWVEMEYASRYRCPGFGRPLSVCKLTVYTGC